MLYIYFKAASDNINGKKLWKKMRRMGIKEGLVEKVKEICRETNSKVNMGRSTRGILDRKEVEARESLESNTIQLLDSRCGGRNKES